MNSGMPEDVGTGSWNENRLDVMRRLRKAERVADELAQLRVAIAVLQTKVTLYAAAIAVACGTAVTIVERLLFVPK